MKKTTLNTPVKGAGSKILNCMKSIQLKMKKAAPHLAIIAALSIMAFNPALAASSSPKDVFDVIIKVLSGFCIAAGAIRAFTGVMAYAEAKDEGEGPAMAKARNQITAAILLVVLGAAGVGLSSTLATAITNAMS